jgi:murein DD-endopeptidase MepM/ murein hydrolase activator NlpD
MAVDRVFEGRKSSPWQGGQYGFVRDPERAGGGLVYTKFHEGVDIAPVRRDAAGEPLDTVGAIAGGRVVHAATVSSRSNYGKYVVVEHRWEDGPFYSLYAHLMSVAVNAGQLVSAGQVLGRLGYTGSGINRARAHLHLELNLLLNDRFELWHDAHYTTPNHHGRYNGLNLAGVDIAALFLGHRRDPGLTMRGFIAAVEPYYRVAVPRAPGFDLSGRYPWLVNGGLSDSGALEITFSRSGLPLAVQARVAPVAGPVVTWVRPSASSHGLNTVGRLTGSGDRAGLSKGGGRYVQLVAGLF